MSIKLVLVGCGNMGYAMLAGWVQSGRVKPGEVAVVEPAAALRERAAALGVPTASDIANLPSGAQPDVVVVAVKPQVIRDVLVACTAWGNGKSTFLSIAAGTPVSTFQQILGRRTPIIRCMPNIPAVIGKGMIVVYRSPQVTKDVEAFVLNLLSANGRVAMIRNEGLMDAATAVSGSGPAYVFHFIECLTAAAEKVGLPADTAKLLALQTVYGATSLAAESKAEPGDLRQQVTSPNGTTAAALSILMGEDRLENLLGAAIEAARARSEELGDIVLGQ